MFGVEIMGLIDLFKKQHKETTKANNKRLVIEYNSPITEGAFTKEFLGLLIYDGSLAPLIDVGSRVPINKKYIFSTYEDGQNQIILKLYRGIELEATKAFSLGQFQILGIPSMQAGEPRIEVEFSIDDNNIYISAKDDIQDNYLEIIRVLN
jgi:molecular chaperone DnaK (HSP70)